MVVDLPLEILVYIDTTWVGKKISARRSSSKPGNMGFRLNFYGEHTVAEANAILDKFLKDNPLKSLKVSEIV